MMRTASIDAAALVRPESVAQAASNLANLAYEVLQEIELLCSMALTHLETPGETSDAETAARTLEMIEARAVDIARAIGIEASCIGLEIKLARRERRKAARVFAAAREGAPC